MRALDEWWQGRSVDWDGREAECIAFQEFFLLLAQPTRFSARDYRRKSLFWNDCQCGLALAHEQMKTIYGNPFGSSGK